MALAWITGAGGLIGNYLVKTTPTKWEARPLTRADVDLLHFEKVNSLMHLEKPAAIIHCAAISKNPQCDADPATAMRVNKDATANLAANAAAEKIPFIFLSSDLVFDGKKGNYTESDSPNPISA